MILLNFHLFYGKTLKSEKELLLQTLFKALDSVDHGILFKKLSNKGLPLAVVRLLLSWYSSQECCVRWGSCCSKSLSVSNGVCQGSVLFPLLFVPYLDGLLSDLVESGVGCYILG